MMESPKICPICREPCLSNYSTIFKKGAGGINEVSRPENDNFTIRPGIHNHVSYRKNHIRTPGVPSSSTEVSYRKSRASFGRFLSSQREKRKLRNQVMSLVKTERLIKQSIKLSLTEKMMSGPLTLKDAMLV